MKCAMFVALALTLAPAAHAELYKHVDKNGKVTYSDQPPVNADAKRIYIPKSVTDAPAPPKSYVAQDKDLEKKRKESAEKQAKSDEAAQKARAAEQRCAQARQAHQMYQDGGRIFKTDEKGERVFMSDAEIESARERSRRDMEEACKGQ